MRTYPQIDGSIRYAWGRHVADVAPFGAITVVEWPGRRRGRRPNRAAIVERIAALDDGEDPTWRDSLRVVG